MINVGIDISALPYNRGVSRYTSNLVLSLQEIGETAVSVLGYSLRNRQVLNDFVKKNHLHGQLFSYPPSAVDLLWKMNLFKVKNSLPNIDVFHSWDYLQPPDTNLPIVSTIHDLYLLKDQNSAHSDILGKHQKSWSILKKRQAKIITPSQAVKKDVVELLEFDERQVSVIYEAVPREITKVSNALSDEKVDLIKKQLDLNEPFALFVGTREPRKNLERVINAWQKSANDIRLFVVGQKGWDKTSSSSFLNRFTKLVDQKRLIFLEKVNNQELVTLYSSAEFLLFPSLEEGFGLPILEAYYHGCRVLTSNNSGMKEVAGNAAVLVNPTDQDSIEQGIKLLLSENQEEKDNRFKKMILRLHLFSWTKAAQETARVYQKAYNQFYG